MCPWHKLAVALFRSSQMLNRITAAWPALVASVNPPYERCDRCAMSASGLTAHVQDYLCWMIHLPHDAYSARQTPARASSPRAGLVVSAAGTLVGMAAVHLTAFPSGPEPLAAVTVFLLGAILLWVKLPDHYPHSRFGACNAVTLFRAGMGATLLTPLLLAGSGAADVNGWAVVTVAVLALSLDGVDGWLARRSGLASSYGARFDMEVDAALALLLALLALANGVAGPWVLLLGLMRYVFVAASWVLGWLAAPLPDKFGRKVVCVIQIAALIALQAPILDGDLAFAIALGASVALIWSFGRDILWLWRHRT